MPEATAMETLIASITTGLTTVATDALSVISGIVPVALTVVGAMIVVTIGIKAFKRVVGR